ncbi:hypothetical protein WISP_38702 [Willisornis vidua]|uniref:small monomeric GTPase n=1 Tax=Willisornis vidua TaxID=1566151 RepID=A0ABQ9DND4_9PASS|nr:hypothetical protein WISP_38702 [Willisornis vidua]
MECTLREFADDTRLGGNVNLLEGIPDVPGYIKRNVISRLKEVILLSYSTLWRNPLENCVQLRGSQDKKELLDAVRNCGWTTWPGQVSTEEGKSLAREYSCSFFETSAALRFYIDDVFHGLVREIRRKESSLPMVEKKMKRKDSLWKKLKGSLKKKKENTT